MRYKIKLNDLLFNINFIIFFITLFFEDLAFKSDITTGILFFKIILLFTLGVTILFRNINSLRFYKLLYLLIFCSFILIATGDFFFLFVILLGYLSTNIEDEKIYILSLKCYIFMIIIALFLYITGFLNNYVTYRTDFSTQARYSLGFNFSAVLPLIFCYMLCIYIVLNGRKRKIRFGVLFIFFILSYILFNVCISRNAFYVTLLLLFMVIIFESKVLKSFLEKPIKIIAKWILFICVSIPVVSAILRSKGIFMFLWHRYDYFFTNRSLLGASAIDAYGIKIINFMRYSAYKSILVDVDSYIHKGIVLDSAYMYMLIRYGVLILVLFVMTFFNYYKKNKEDIYSCLVFIAIAILNMTDNDFFSYGCLPFLLISIKYIFKRTEYV